MQTDSIDPSAYARRWKTLGVLSLSLLIIGLDNTVLNVALPTLQTHFSASGVDAAVDRRRLSARLRRRPADHGHARRPLRAQARAAVRACAVRRLERACRVRADRDQLIVLRAAMGIGGAMIMPATLSVIIDIFPREERRKAIGIWSAIAGVGIGLGPFVGGLLLEWFSWSSVFWLNVPIVAVALVAGFVLVPESRDPRPGAFDLRGAGLSIATLVTLVYGSSRRRRAAGPTRVVLGCFAAAAVLGAAFVAWERKSPAPMLPLGFFADPRFTVASSASGSSSSR